MTIPRKTSGPLKGGQAARVAKREAEAAQEQADIDADPWLRDKWQREHAALAATMRDNIDAHGAARNAIRGLALVQRQIHEDASLTPSVRISRLSAVTGGIAKLHKPALFDEMIGRLEAAMRPGGRPLAPEADDDGNGERTQ